MNNYRCPNCNEILERICEDHFKCSRCNAKWYDKTKVFKITKEIPLTKYL